MSVVDSVDSLDESFVYCPRDGSKWHACSIGSRFVGCCKLNPCETGCQDGYTSPVLIDSRSYARFPDATCGNGSEFYTCSVGSDGFYFWGCCKSNPCTGPTGGCPAADAMPAFIDRPEQYQYYANVTAPAPPSITLGLTADEPPVVSSTTLQYVDRRHTNIFIVAWVCIALLILLPLIIALWISYRAWSARCKKSLMKLENVSLPTQSAEPNQENVRSTLVEKPASKTLPDLSRIGVTTLYTLLATTFVILGVLGFLAFLWFEDSKNGTWNNIMIRNWATRAVSISALCLRTAVDLQAAIATAILVSLALESRSGVNLHQLASYSPIRTCSTSPWSFIAVFIEDIRHSASSHKRSSIWILITGCLLITTSALQFSSTLLLSDLKPGALGGNYMESSVRTGLSYRNITQRITRDSAWTSNPPFYPAFGEYAEPVAATADGIADTGVLLRALLPYATATSRESLRSYSGKALVLDARVSCQAPMITAFDGSGHYTELSGVINATRTASMLQKITNSTFSCALAGPDQYTLCQLGRPFPSFIGSLNSQFENSTSYGTAFLVAKGTTKTSKSIKRLAQDHKNSEWLDVDFANRTDSGASLSLCFAPWDASVLNVALSSNSKRTEPLLQWWRKFQTLNVLDHFLPGRENERQILNMEKPVSFLGDYPPRHERPLVQSDASGSSAAAYGSNTPLPEDWSIFLTGEPLITALNGFSRAPSQAIAADPALAAIFVDTMAATGSVAWALSSLITVLSMNNYYSQQPAFDRLDTVTVSFFTDVLSPHGILGFMVVICTLLAHFLILSILIILFVSKTRFSLLGNAWSAFSQMAESRDLQEHMSDTSLTDDDSVLQKLKKSDGLGLRARLVGKGARAEVMVE